MNPILLYPQNTVPPSLFLENAEKQGVGMLPISEKVWERIDEILFAEELVRIRKNHVPIPEEKVMATLNRIINEQ